jgi:hypothetical protein
LDGAHSSPKSIFLNELVKDHEPALVYDLRKLGVNPKKVDFDELVLLVDMLLRDPSSWTHASVAKWKHPISYEWAVLVGQYDLLAQVHSGKRKPKPFPRPWPDPDQRQKGKVRADARELLLKAKNGDLEWQNKPTPM